MGYNPWGHRESADTAEQLSTHTNKSLISLRLFRFHQEIKLWPSEGPQRVRHCSWAFLALPPLILVTTQPGTYYVLPLCR